MSTTSDRSYAVYSPRLLRWYDFLVLGLSNRFVWRCPTADLLRLYNRCITANHLDVGVGTGYFLDQCRFPGPEPRVVLLDANPHCLQATSRRIARYRPVTWQADLWQPLVGAESPFDSISLNYVLHCLPGSLAEKGRVIDNLLPLLRPRGVLFGATLLAHGVPVTPLARHLMRVYNDRKIFGNARDSLEGLRELLETRFPQVTIELRGCSALFEARCA